MKEEREYEEDFVGRASRRRALGGLTEAAWERSEKSSNNLEEEQYPAPQQNVSKRAAAS